MTLRSQTLPELEKILCGAEYLGPSCFHLILWIQFHSHSFEQKGYSIEIKPGLIVRGGSLGVIRCI